MDEHDPVDDSEFVFRRIHRSFFDPALPVLIRIAAFRPNPNDTTGLSVFRAQFASAAAILANLDPGKAKDYYVVRLSVAALKSLGLTVEPEPVAAGPPGHAVIPQLGWLAYQAQKQKMKLVQVELARLASADVVHVASP